MSGFIEVTRKNGHRRLINIRHIEEVMETSNKNICSIYMAFNIPNAIEQDYIEVAESYDAIIEKIADATVLNAYAQVQGGY